MCRQLLLALPLALSLLGAEKAAPKPIDKDFEGTWEMVTSVREGQKLPRPRGGKKIVLTHENGEYTVKIGDDLVAVGTYRTDGAKTPRTMNLTPGIGPNKGKTLLGIYEVKGGEIRSCLADPGKDRPAEFAAKEGSGRLLNTWKRIQP